MCDVFTTIIKTEYLEFLTGLVFNFLVPGLEGFESFTFIVEIVDPQVARGVISEGDKVEFPLSDLIGDGPQRSECVRSGTSVFRDGDFSSGVHYILPQTQHS